MVSWLGPSAWDPLQLFLVLLPGCWHCVTSLSPPWGRALSRGEKRWARTFRVGTTPIHHFCAVFGLFIHQNFAASPLCFFFLFFFSYPKFLSILFSNFVKRTILQHWSFLKGFLAPLLSSFLLSLSTQSKEQGVRAPPKYPQGGRNSLISWRVSLGARGMCSHWALPLHLSDRIWGSPASSLPCHEQRNTW